jgi:hypothetical protein
MLSSAIFCILLISIYLVHMHFFRVNVLFYSVILDGVLATLLSSVLIWRVGYFDLFTVFEKFQMVFIWLLISYTFAISVPTVLDRSLSFYILEKLQQRGGGIRLESFEKVFNQEYVKEHRLIDVRLTEQQGSGTVVIQDGCVKLTPRGQRLASFSRYFRQHFLPKQRLLMGQYTSDLTDPFRHSKNDMGYECQ